MFGWRQRITSRSLQRWPGLLAVVFLLGMTLDTERSVRGGTAEPDARSRLASTVSATGPEAGSALEDRVEVFWSTDAAVAMTSSFAITRNDTLIHVAASTETLFEDLSAVPNRTYTYCVAIQASDGTETTPVCDQGGRIIARPTGFAASDGLYEGHVLLSWSDRSRIEAGYNVYRNAGNALAFDGTDDYVSTNGVTDIPGSFTFEFWARRASIGTPDFIVNLETVPMGDPVDLDLEIGFTADDRFQVGFGTNALLTPDPYVDLDWHHWAVAYDAPNRRRFIYRDGALVVTDVVATGNAPTGNLEFGRRAQVGSPSSRGYYHGQLDEIRYWTVALTADQVRAVLGGLPGGSEPGLAGYWPMDVQSGLVAPDVVGNRTGALTSMTANWEETGVPAFRVQIDADLTSYADRTAVTEFRNYTYRVAAFEDVDGDGVFEPGTDYESEQQSDSGWRALLTPPGSVSATDGQYIDRVRVTWVDLSSAESNYQIYRDDALVGTVPANSTLYDDLAATGTHTYCVAGVSGGVESVRSCDEGRVGGLAAPADVASTDGVYDDRVLVSWTDMTDTEDGFEVFRDDDVDGDDVSDDVLLATLDANAEEYNDLSAVQDVAYIYCVRAFSKADPLNPSYSEPACTAPSQGRRAVVLHPVEMTATDKKFEDRVELSWKNPSTTAMLFKLYRDDVLIQVLDYSRTSATDTGIPSDTGIEYCVSAGTVVAPAAAVSMQRKVAQVLQTIQHNDAVRLATGGAATSPEARLAAAYEALGADAAAKTAGADVLGFVESDTVCAMGSRLLAAPTDADATDDEFESHVELNWTDNSSVETGYTIYRKADGGSPVSIATLSPNRTTYSDYTGVSGTSYTYSVEAFDAFDASHSESDEGKRTLKPPTNFTASDGTSETVVELSWRDNSDAEKGYRISRKVGSASFEVIGTTGKNEVGYLDVIPSGQLGSLFDYKVETFDDYGASLSATNQGNTRIEAPGNVNASDGYDGKVVVVWVDRSEVEASYQYTKRLVNSTAMPAPTTLAANATSLTDTNVESGKQYEYCVSAVVNGLASQATCDVGSTPVTSDGGGGGATTTALKISVQASSFAVGAQFGTGLAADGNTVLVGAPRMYKDFVSSRPGMVYRYYLYAGNTATGNEWGMPTGVTKWGHAVAISGNYAAVGAPGTDDAAGALVRVLKHNGSVWTHGFDWDDRDTTNINTGISVAVQDSFVLVGDNIFEGKGRVFILNAEDPAYLARLSRWNEVWAPMTPAPGAEMGFDVDMTRIDSALYAFVGAPGRDRVHIMTCDLAASTNDCMSGWAYVEGGSLGSPFGSGERFGHAIAFNDEIGVVGAPGAGKIAIYEYSDGQWYEKAVYSPTDGAGEFGASVALYGTTILVGAPGEQIAHIEDAGAVYMLHYDKANDRILVDEDVRYDARVAGEVSAARFGTSVAFAPDVGDGFYLVGAPEDKSATSSLLDRSRHGAVYSIPFGMTPPDDLIVPADVELVDAGNFRAADGTAPDRIQVRWKDESEGEDGQRIYRSNAEGGLELVGELSENVEVFDDFEAAPGEAYKYCVTAFYKTMETEMQCDIGWRPPNGTIAGRLAAAQSGGTEDALVCLKPNPNKALLFDGTGGHVVADVGTDLSVYLNFTLEVWIRPDATDGLRYIVSKDSSYALAINNGKLQLILFRSGGIAEPSTSTLDIGIGTWTHVAVSMNSAGDQNVGTFYVDGVADSTSFYITSGASQVGDTLTIGRGMGTGYFEGAIDEVRIWDVGRDAAAIEATRFARLEGDEENLLGYWDLDQGLRRIVPDLSESARHGNLAGGVYLIDDGAPLKICGETSAEGNYSISRIRYGESTEFNVIPSRPDRVFEPTYKKITLTVESPVQNEVYFNDITAFNVAGLVQYQDVFGTDTLSCPVPDVRIHAGKENLAIDDNVRIATGADGSYVIALDPSRDEGDTWFIIPEFVDRENGELVHTFSPASREIFLGAHTAGVDFLDRRRHTLSGHFSGGDPELCGRDIGQATIRIYTQDGCYDRTITVSSGDASHGAFSIDLPPLEYLVEVVSITGAPTDVEEEVTAFFAGLGTLEVDLTKGDLARNLIYHAPVTLAIEGLNPPSCPGQEIIQQDEDGNTLRILPAVPIIGEYAFVPLTIRVHEDYGSGQTCPVGEGTVTIFDAIADRVDADSTLQIEDGVVKYTTFGASPNIYSGARIGGVDRSFQKPITFVAQVEGRDPLMETRWAIVEGFRERAATFVSATTEEFPLLILHDPPGSNSSASLEKGATFCNVISNMKTLGGSAGVDFDIKFGFNQFLISSPLGLGVAVENGAGFTIGAHVDGGADVASLQSGKPNRTICVSTSEAINTSSDPGWVGEDIHVGVALNLVFAIADVLDCDACAIQLSETLAADLDQAKPFETTYAYGKTHIEYYLIPQLEKLLELAGGDVSLEGEVDGKETAIRLKSAVENWKKQLANNEALVEEGLADPEINRSFSGGTAFSYAEGVDTTTVTHYQSVRAFVNTNLKAGGMFTIFGHESTIAAILGFKGEWVSQEQSTDARSQKIGYTLEDQDGGDYFSVDVGKDPRYGTFVFGTRSGASSNPCESDTQCRDNPIIQVDPPVRHGVSPGDAARFQLTLINGSESMERRIYALAAPAEINPNNAPINVGGSPLNVPRTYLLDPGKAITINMDVFASPSAFSYRDVGVMLYPPDEYPIWAGFPILDFAMSDTAFFSVFFDSTGGHVMASSMTPGWNWFSINREGGDVDSVLADVPAKHGDKLRSQRAESRYDSTAGWRGALTELVPGQGYRIRLQEPSMLRLMGEPVEPEEPMELAPGWSWIGYLPAKRMPVDAAMASLNDRVVEGDAIVGQRAFAQYVKGVGWVGTLQEMVPGESYAVYLDGGGKLLYPPTPEEVVLRDPLVRETTVRGPEWEAAAENFDASMTVVAEIQMYGETLQQTTTKVAVFDGKDIRGVGEVHYVEALDQYLTFFLIYGGGDEEESLVVHVYDGEQDVVYENVATIRYAAQTRLGQPASPVVIELANVGRAPELLDLPETLALHANFPNPFNEYTTIGYDLPQAAEVRLVVYDILGRRVDVLVDGEQKAGRHKVVFNGRTVASGLYIYRMEIGRANYVGKMVLVK